MSLNLHAPRAWVPCSSVHLTYSVCQPQKGRVAAVDGISCLWGKTFDPVEVLAIIAHFLFPFLINLAYSLIIKAEKGLTRGIRNVTDCVLLYTFLNQATVFPVQRQVQRTSQWRSNPRHFCTQLRDWCRWQALNSAQWAEVMSKSIHVRVCHVFNMWCLFVDTRVYGMHRKYMCATCNMCGDGHLFIHVGVMCIHVIQMYV